MKRTQAPVYLKSIFDAIEPKSLNDYMKIETHIQFQRFAKGQVLSPSVSLENTVHILVHGMLAKENAEKIMRIYLPAEIVMDKDSFLYKTKSIFRLRALEHSFVITLSHSAIAKILADIPSFQSLATKIIEREKIADCDWEKIIRMRYQDAIPLIKEKTGRHFHSISRKKLAEMLGVTPKTIFRYQKKIFENRKSLFVRAKEKEIFNYPFTSRMHGELETVDRLVTQWAEHHRLFPFQKDLTSYQKRKISWLSARLYPDTGLEKGTLLAKLHTFLWCLEECSNKISRGHKSRVWKELECQLKLTMDGKKRDVPQIYCALMPFLAAYSDLWTELHQRSSTTYITVFRDAFGSYLREKCWQASAEDHNRPFPIGTYLEKRSFLSASHLALHLLPLALEEKHPNILSVWPYLRQTITQAATMIFTSQDLLSHSRETSSSDHKNWVTLLANSEGFSVEDVTKYLLEAHNNALKTFLAANSSLLENCPTQNTALLAAISAIKYQIAGTLAWSLLDTN